MALEPMQPCMSPRAVRPGIYHATFTCVRRLYLLWPGKRLNKAIRYLAALTSERYGVLIHNQATSRGLMGRLERQAAQGGQDAQAGEHGADEVSG